jgi:cytochrome c553
LGFQLFLKKMHKPHAATLSFLIISAVATASTRAAAEFPTWAYPVAGPAVPGTAALPDDRSPKHVPDSNVALTKAQFAAHVTAVPDWHPGDHPAMPGIVSVGREPKVWACGYCHLPNGAGRPENTSLAGLTPAYFKQQLADFKHGNRAGSEPKRAPQNFMIALANAATDDEIAQAAAYFAALKPESYVKVVEADMVPISYVAGAMLAKVPGGGLEPLGDRIIEIPEDLERADNRDSRTPYLAYVPVGSIEKGASLAATPKAGMTQQCAVCHGPELKGLGDVPRLAGRSPSYLMRQLYDYKSGTRTGASGLMKTVVASLSQQDMIAIVAYVSSRKP